MAAASQLKASDKQSICKKLVTVLKKRYKASIPKSNRATLETILFAACLEDVTIEEAEERYELLNEEFHDLNEIRVSSISELLRVFDGLPEPEKRAMRIRNTLQYVFEKHFEFDFEAIRRKTFEAAERQLAKIKGLSPFVRNYSLQAALGSHVVPLDQSMCNAVIWLGLVEPKATPDSAADDLKSALRKSDAQMFCHLLRQLATDPKLRKAFESAAANAPEEGYDALTAPERLTEFFKNPRSPKKRATTRKKAVPAKKKASTTTRKKKKGGTTARKKTVKKKTKTKKKTKKSRSSSR